MKITAINTIPLSCKVDPPYASAAGVQSRRGGLLVEIETDAGITGIGESGPAGGSSATAIQKDLAPLLIGEDPLMIEYLWQKMFTRTRQYGRPRRRHAGDERHRHRPLGHRWQGRETAGLQTAWRLP